jgi:hypothetical protein
MACECRTKHSGYANRVLVDVWADAVWTDRIVARLERHDAWLDVEVAAELLPHHVHIAAEHQIGVWR